MQFTEIGHVAYKIFNNVTMYYPYAETPLFVVMPNHIHAIIFINNDHVDSINNRSDCRRDAINRVSTSGGITTLRNPMLHKCLGTVVRDLKACISHYAHKHGILFTWQPRFHDHIIRNNYEMGQIAEYIENNVIHWELDELYN